MKNDLKIIKKQYGEDMMHLCRELFNTILDNSPGVLSSILLETFEPNHFLYTDLLKKSEEVPEIITDFRNYIYSIYQRKVKLAVEVRQEVEDPKTLIKYAGYTLYECKSEADIQRFRKYYAKGEELCTFYGNRLRGCHVYFAVREDADELKRSDFSNPNRQDKYGTSVLSIQFTRDSSHTLSIKNRYNHTADNPDATYSNNLDNIVPGLTQSFAEYYGMKQLLFTSRCFELPGYVRANDGKYYKYNYEIDNVYYCPGNIVINNFEVTKYEKEKYLVMDYFVLDLVNKKFMTYSNDSFPKTIGSISCISIKNENDYKKVIITPDDGEDIIIELNQFNQIVSFKNDNLKEIPDGFLQYVRHLRRISLKQAQIIGEDFLFDSYLKLEISIPNALEIGNQFIINGNVSKIVLPKVKKIGNKFLLYNSSLGSIMFPEVEEIGNDFLMYNNKISDVILPKVRKIGNSFLENDRCLQEIDFPNVLEIGSFFCYGSENIWKVRLPRLQIIGEDAMVSTSNVIQLNIPENAELGVGFLKRNKLIKSRKNIKKKSH